MRTNESARALAGLVALVAILSLIGLAVWPGPDVALATDDDGDGLSNAFETAYGTDPQSSDSDSDNLNDFDEIFGYGTDPLNADTNGNAVPDDTDPDPVGVTGSPGGSGNADFTYASNLNPKEARAGTSAVEGVGVYMHNGEFVYRQPLMRVRGRRLNLDVTITYRSGITYDGPVGMNWFLFPEIRPDGDDVDYYCQGVKYEFAKDAEDANEVTYTSPAGFAGTLVLDKSEDEWVLTFPNGYEEFLNADDQHADVPEGGLLSYGFDTRWGVDVTLTWDDEQVTILTDDRGEELAISYYDTGRVESLTDHDGNVVLLKYNIFDQLASVRSPTSTAYPDGKLIQYGYTTGSTDGDLNNNLIWVKTPTGDKWLQNQYSAGDQDVKQYIGEHDLEFSFGVNTTTVTDRAGNQRIWAYSGRCPTSLREYSNRDVRSGDPTYWETTFDHDANFRRIEVVFPEGNRVDYAWNSDYQLTERRRKETDTDTDSEDDLTESWTYSQYYAQVATYANAAGDTTTNTVDTSGNVTCITYPTITHLDPDVTITESFTYNSYGQRLTYTDGEGNVTQFEYFSTGAPLGWLDTVTVDYGTGNLNLETSYTYNDVGDVLTVTDPRGNTTTLTVDEYHQVQTVTGPSPQGYETEYDYTANGWLDERRVENVDENNNRVTAFPWFTTTYVCDMLGQVTSVAESITASTDRSTTYAYDENGNKTSIVLPEGNEIRRVFDERDLPYSETRGYGSSDATTTYMTYDGNRNATIRKDGRNNLWESSYDDFDRLVGTEDPLGNYRTITRDDMGNATYLKAYKYDDTLMAERRQYFDELGQRYKTEDLWDGTGLTEGTVTTEYWHDRCGNLTQVQDDNDKYLYQYFDGANRLYERKDHLNNRTVMTLDANGNATLIQEIEVVSGGTETYETNQTFDKYNRLTVRSVENRNDSNDLHTSTWALNSQGRPVTFTDAEGNDTDYTYDGLGRMLTKSVDLGSSDSEDLAIEWDDNSNRISLTDDNGSETEYAYDDCDRPELITYEDAETESFGYDDCSNLTSYTDQIGTSVTNTYDVANRLTSRSITLGTGVGGHTSETYGYDALGRMISAQTSGSGEPTLTVERDHDTLGRILSETQKMTSWTNRTISYEYDGVGNVTNKTYPSSFELDITSDALGRWTLLEDGSSNDIATWTWAGPGRRLVELEYENGTTVVPGYDGFRRMTDLDHEDSGSSVFAGFDYAFDKVGNKLYEERTHDSGKGDVYSYNKAYKMTQVLLDCDDPSAEIDDPGSEAYDSKIEYNMDDIGNRSSIVETPYQQQGTTTSYTTNSMNEYSVIGQASRTHDDNGNLTDDGTNEYHYNWRNQLIEVVRKSDSYVLGVYVYDGLGRRVRKTTEDETVSTRFLYDGIHCVEERHSTGSLLRKFAYGQGIDEILWMEAPDQADVDDDQNTTELMRLHCHLNSLGSVTHLTDPCESVVEQYEYTPYGQTTVLDGSGSDLSGVSDVGNPYMYTARRLDEDTGLYCYRARSLDCITGRFLQRDPLREGGGVNLYAYVEDNPVGRTDPLGLKWHVHRTLPEDSSGSATRVILKSDDEPPKYQYAELRAGTEQIGTCWNRPDLKRGIWQVWDLTVVPVGTPTEEGTVTPGEDDDDDLADLGFKKEGDPWWEVWEWIRTPNRERPGYGLWLPRRWWVLDIESGTTPPDVHGPSGAPVARPGDGEGLFPEDPHSTDGASAEERANRLHRLPKEYPVKKTDGFGKKP